MEAAAAHLVRRSYSDPWWERRRGSAAVHETVTLYGLPLVADRTVAYATVDPSGARDLFIEHALVQGEVDLPLPVLADNRSVLVEARFAPSAQEK